MTLTGADDEKIQALDWLSADRYSDRQRSLRDYVVKHNPDSGRDFFGDCASSNFLEIPGFTWLHGNPGSGKTTFCSTLIHRLVSDHEEALERIVAFWYFDPYAPSSLDVSRALRSLLRQLGSSRPE